MNKLLHLPISNLQDVPQMLRKLADDIENSNYGPVHSAAVVLEAPGLPVFGFGQADPANASELFACAHHKLLLDRLNCIYN